MAKNKKKVKNDNRIVREIVAKNLEKIDRPKLEDIIEIIRPHYIFTKDQLMERELKNRARYIMRSFKDAKKVRTYFLNNNGAYINIEKSTDLGDLEKVDTQLSVKYTGILSAIEKVRARIYSVIVTFNKKMFK